MTRDQEEKLIEFALRVLGHLSGSLDEQDLDVLALKAGLYERWVDDAIGKLKEREVAAAIKELKL